jgi:uncharacterized membrane protein YdjX (TVP38/TMEM64 family)
MKRLLSKRGMLVLLLVIILLVASIILRSEDVVEKTLVWIEGMDFAESLFLISLYIPISIFFIPAFIISLATGFMLGVFPGFLIISTGTTLGAIVSFILARTVARGLIEQKLIGHHKFQSLDRAVGRQGFKVVLLSRIAPFLSYNVLNYMYGISQVSVRDYVLGTWLGMIPASVAFAFLGASARSIPDILADPTASITGHPFWIIGGLLLTGIILYFLVSRVKRVFDRIEHQLPEEEKIDIMID